MSALSRRRMLLAASALLGGCGMFGGDKSPAPMEIEIKPAPEEASLDFLAVASPLINPAADGTPAPAMLRLYQLKGDTAFVNANFRQLWEDDEATLGPTLLGKTEMILEPGGVKRIASNLIEGTVIVAVVVGFRNFEEAKWRAMVGVQGESKMVLKATLKTLSVDLGPQDPSQPGAKKDDAAAAKTDE